MSSALKRSISSGQRPALVYRKSLMDGYYTVFSLSVPQHQLGEGPNKGKRGFTRRAGQVLVRKSKPATD